MSSPDKSEEPVSTVVNGHTFTIDSRYVLKDSRILGKGSFGVVCTAYDSVRKLDIAIKRIRPYANDEWDARHTLREIRLLKLLGPHPNIVSLYELSLYETKTELYMMMELMDCDLHRVIQSKQPLSEKHHKCFVKQIIEGIKAMHAIGVFHRDLKPGNILVSKDCQVRITDFGLARFMDEDTRRGDNEQNPMTEYVVTRWYRCPELLLSPNNPYSEAIDMWSIGCILGELLKRKPLFPGKSHAHQVQLIFEVVGYNGGNPSEEMGFPVAGEAASFLDKRCRFRKQSLQRLIPEATPDAIHLLEDLLQVNPTRRPSAHQSLQYAFLADAEILNDYTIDYLKKPTLDFFDFEQEKYSVQQLKDLIDSEVHSAAANAYRSQRKVSPATTPATNNVQQRFSAATASATNTNTATTTAAVMGPGGQRLLSSHSVKNMTGAGTAANVTESSSSTAANTLQDYGPASQLATQVRGNIPAYPDSADYTNIQYQQQQQQQQQQNLLTTVRNDLGPPGTRGRKSIPKTPSPKQMDMILQKDLQNKRRFSSEQQSLQQAQQEAMQNNHQSTTTAAAIAGNNNNQGRPGPTAGNPFSAAVGGGGAGGGGNSSSTNQLAARLQRSTFPHQQPPTTATTSTTTATTSGGNNGNGGMVEDSASNNSNGGASKRFGKLINSVAMPFPSLTSRMKGFTSGTGNVQIAPGAGASGNGTTSRTGSAGSTGSTGSSNSYGNGTKHTGYVGDGGVSSYDPYAAPPVNRSSHTMVNTGSNVLYHPSSSSARDY